MLINTEKLKGSLKKLQMLFKKPKPIKNIVIEDTSKLKEELQNTKDKNKRLNDLVKYYKEQHKETQLSLRKKVKDLQTPEATAKLISWAKRVKAIGYCDICKETSNLTAHHLYDKSTHPSLAFIDDNGVCLCLTCHNGFHKLYTSKANTTPSMYNKYKIKKMNELILQNPQGE